MSHAGGRKLCLVRPGDETRDRFLIRLTTQTKSRFSEDRRLDKYLPLLGRLLVDSLLTFKGFVRWVSRTGGRKSCLVRLGDGRRRHKKRPGDERRDGLFIPLMDNYSPLKYSYFVFVSFSSWQGALFYPLWFLEQHDWPRMFKITSGQISLSF